MSFQEKSTSAKKTQGSAPDTLREVSVIGLAANWDDPLYHRAIENLSTILEELKSIKATRIRHRRGPELCIVTFERTLLLKLESGARLESAEIRRTS